MSRSICIFAVMCFWMNSVKIYTPILLVLCTYLSLLIYMDCNSYHTFRKIDLAYAYVICILGSYVQSMQVCLPYLNVPLFQSTFCHSSTLKGILNSKFSLKPSKCCHSVKYSHIQSQNIQCLIQILTPSVSSCITLVDDLII